MEKPKQLSEKEIDLSGLKGICQQYIEFYDNDDKYYEDNDYSHYIFEKAMTTIFGEDVFDWINQRQD